MNRPIRKKPAPARVRPSAAPPKPAARRPEAKLPPLDVQRLVHELQVHELELELQCDELHRSEQALAAARDRYADLFDFAPVAHFVLNPAGEILEANLAAAKLLGLDRNHLLRQNFSRFVSPAAKDQFYLFCSWIFQTDAPQTTDLSLVTAQGQPRMVQLAAVRSAEPSAQQCRICCTDITERKQAEEQLRKLWRAVEQNPASIVITDAAGAVEYVNPKFTQVTGYSAAEVRGQNPRLLKSGDLPAEAYQQMWQTLLAGREWRGEFHNRKKNGELYWESALISPLKADDGTITHFIGVKEDITERKLAQAALQESEARLRHLTKATYEGVCFSENGRVCDANDQYLKMFGYDRGEIIGKAIADLVAPASRALVAEAIRTGLETRYELQLLRQDGSIFYAEAQSQVMQVGDRKLRVTAVRDVTERKRLEAEVHTQRERWERETLRRLEEEQERIGRDLHDGLCQTMVGAKFQIGALGQRLSGPANAPARAAVQTVEQLINRSIHQARTLAKGLNPVTLTTNGLAFALEDLAKEIRTAGIAQCRFRTGISPLVLERNLANHLYRITQEAVQNALKHGRARKISLRLSQQAGRLLLTIADDGLGLPAHPEKSAGAGFHNMRMRAAMIGGLLAIQKGRRAGTVVRVSLPLPPR